MAAILGIATLAGGVLLVAVGTMTISRSLRGLARAGVFNSIYWASFRRYPGYRVRSLRPALLACVGLIMVVAGLAVLYGGLVGFYAGRLLTPG